MKKAEMLSTLLLFVALGGGIAPIINPVAARAQAAAAQASPFKDQAEYAAYTALTKATDPKEQIDLADKYLAAYPQSKVALNVYGLKLQAYQKLNDIPKVEETANKLLEIDPKNLNALFLLSTLFPQTFKAQDPDADKKLSAASENAKKGLEQLAALPKPANMSDDDFKKQKDQLEATFHQTAGFVALQKKDFEQGTQELHKTVEQNPSNAAAFYQLGVAEHAMKPPKDDEAIWVMAHAIGVTGPTALPPAVQAQVKDYLSKVYENVHGSTEGFDAVLTQAASAPFPPQGFHIKTQEEAPPPPPEPAPVAAAPKRELTVKAEELTDFDVIQKYLQAGGQKAEDTCDILKGTSLPLPGKVINPPTAAKPKTIQLAVGADAQKLDRYDVEMTLAAPLARPVAKGAAVEFEGTVEACQGKPFLLKLVDAKRTK